MVLGNFQCLASYLFGKIVWQGPTVLAVDMGGGCLDIFSLICLFSLLSPPLCGIAQYRLKCCLKGPYTLKQSTNKFMYSTFI